jgi:hypothetical protein
VRNLALVIHPLEIFVGQVASNVCDSVVEFKIDVCANFFDQIRNPSRSVIVAGTFVREFELVFHESPPESWFGFGSMVVALRL